MTSLWALKLEPEHVAHAGAWRLQPHVDVHAATDALWLRGPADEASIALLDRTPVGRRYTVLADQQLVPHGAMIPQGHLPTGNWQPLRVWLHLELPPAGYGAADIERCPFQLVRDEQAKDPNLLVATMCAWTHFATAAPAVRLAPLSFAAAADGRVVVRGVPLPAMEGRFYVVTDQIAVPAGWRCEPPVAATVLAEMLQLGEHDLALLNNDGTYELVPGEGFVQATRAAVRATAEGAEA